MSTATIPSPIHREPEFLGQTVVVISASSGIGFETVRRAHAEGAPNNSFTICRNTGTSHQDRP